MELRYKCITKALFASYTLHKFEFSNDGMQLARIFNEIKVQKQVDAYAEILD